MQVLSGHGSALIFALPSLAEQYAAGGKTSLSSDVLLALIYTYPLLAVALFTLLVRPRAPQDYFGGVVLMAIALFALWASSDLQGMHGFSFGAGTAPRMFGCAAARCLALRWPRLASSPTGRSLQPITGAARCSYRLQSWYLRSRSVRSASWSRASQAS